MNELSFSAVVAGVVGTAAATFAAIAGAGAVAAHFAHQDCIARNAPVLGQNVAAYCARD